MGIGEEIKQSKFNSEGSKASLNVVFTSHWIGKQHTDILKPFGLTPQQFNVLRILRGQNGTPITVLGIMERMLDRMSNASRLVDKLLEKKYVQRRECPNDRRAVDIIILPKGLELLEQIDKIILNWESKFEKMGKEKLQLLNELLDEFRGSEN